MVEIKDAPIRKITLSFMTLILFSIPVHWASLLLWSHPKYSSDIPFLSRYGESSILDSFVHYDAGMIMPNGGVVEFLLYIVFVVLVVLLLALVANSLNMTGSRKISLSFSDRLISVLMLAMFVIGIHVGMFWPAASSPWANLLSWDPLFLTTLALSPILMGVFFLRWIIVDEAPF